MMIRWTPAVVRLVGYYGNLMLISSFLGLGLGVIAVGWKRRLLQWFPLVLALQVRVMIALGFYAPLHALLLLVIAAYSASLICRVVARTAAAPVVVAVA